MNFKLRKDSGAKDGPTTFDLFENIPIGILAFDKNWIVTYANQTFYNFDLIKNEFKNKLCGINILDKQLFDNAELTNKINSLNSGKDFEYEINNIKLHNGTEISILIRGTPLFDNGKFNGGVLILEDLTISSSTQNERIFKSDFINSFLPNFCDFYLIINSEGLIKFCRRYCKDAKMDFLNNITNKNITDIFSSSTKIPILQTIQSTFQNGTVSNNFLVYSYPEESLEFEINIYPLKDAKGNIELGIVLFNISTEQKKQESLIYSDEKLLDRYLFLLENIADAVVILNAKGKIVKISKGTSNLCDVEVSGLEGKFCNKLFPLLDKNLFDSLKEKVFLKKQWSGNLSFFSKTTKEKSVPVKIIPLELSDKKLLAILCNVQRSSETETIGEKVTENFKKILTISKEYIITFRPDGKIIFANPHFIQKFGYKTSEITGMSILDLIDKESDLLNGFSLDKLKNQAVTTYEIPCLTKEGKTIYCQVTFNAIEDSKGVTKYYNALLKDITNEQLAKTELRQLYNAFDNLSEGIIETEKNKITLVNSAFIKLLNYQNEKQLLGLPLENLIAPQDLPDVINIIGQQNEKTTEYDALIINWLNKDNEEVKLKTKFKYLSPANKFFINVILAEPKGKITKPSPDDREQISQHINEFIKNIPGLIYKCKIQNHRLIPTFFSEKSLEVLGYHNEEFLINPDLFYEIIHPEDFKLFNDKLSGLLSGKQNNSTIIEHRLITKSGNSVWVRNTIFIQRRNDIAENIYGFITDISDQKESEYELKYFAAELKKLNETKDRFISIISHDLRTPFSSILGFTDMLLADTTLDSENRTKYIRYIKDTSLNLLSMLNELLDWTRLKTGRMKFEPQKINAAEFVKDVIRKVTVLINQKEISLESDIAKDINIYADPELLSIAFKNLINNAIKFTKRNGKIKITSGLSNNSKLLIFKIIDNGIGIKEEHLEKLFKINEKFSTLGTEGERGSGLGLILVQEIIKKHNGTIEIKSKTGSGTEVTFTVPVAPGNIMLVDSSQKDRILYSKLINNLLPQTTIIEAVDGKDALNKLNESAPKLIITNHQMQGMDGLELVRQLNSAVLNVKPQIIVLSNNLSDSIVSEYKKYNVKYIFNKPVELDRFKEALNLILNNSN